MISPEILRRYSFFGLLNNSQLTNLAIAAEEIQLEDGDTVFEQGQPATALYFLRDGCIDLYYTIENADRDGTHKEISVCQINPGEPFGISALIEPHILTSTARSSNHSSIIKIEAEALKELFAGDPRFEIIVLRRVAKAAMDRLHDTRIQLAAAWS
jgi:CRP-like cAMP-binding protein